LKEFALPKRPGSTPVDVAPPGPPEPPAPPAISPEERARLIDEGYARGMADGERIGRDAAQALLTGPLGVLGQATAHLHEVASLAPAILEENIAALAVIVARQIISREVTSEREIVVELVRRALTEFPIDQSVRIRVHPLDLSLMALKGTAPDAAPITGAYDARWLADPRITRGGCLVEGRDRIVDGRVDTALERAYRRMSQTDAS
jgi:flagellar biosynthesis/type III secretory pathway protein FliH